jgi:hypothetical protein
MRKVFCLMCAICLTATITGCGEEKKVTPPAPVDTSNLPKGTKGDAGTPKARPE